MNRNKSLILGVTANVIGIAFWLAILIFGSMILIVFSRYEALTAVKIANIFGILVWIVFITLEAWKQMNEKLTVSEIILKKYCNSKGI